MKINALTLAIAVCYCGLATQAQAYTQRVDGTTVNNESVFKTTETSPYALQHVTEGIVNNGVVYNRGMIYLDNNSQGNAITVNKDGWLQVEDGSTANDTVVNPGGRLTVNAYGTISNTLINSGASMEMEANSRSLGELLVGAGGELYIANTDSKLIDVTSNVPATPTNIALEKLTIAGKVTIGPSWDGNDELGTAPPAAQLGPVMVTQVGTLTLQGGSLEMIPYISADQVNRLDVENLSGQGTFMLTTSLADGVSDSLRVTQRATGQFGLMVQDSGREIGLPANVPLVYINSGDAKFNLLNQGGIVEAGVYQYRLYNSSQDGHTQWYLVGGKAGTVPEQNNVDPGVLPAPEPTPVEPTPVSTPILSASAQGVLSMAAASQHILNTELSTLRQRQGNLRSSVADVGVWARYLNDESRLNDHRYASFKNTLSGMEIGADKSWDMVDGKWLLGAFTAYSKSNVSFNLGGNGDVASYSGGLYASYLANSGWYLDSVLKGNRLSQTVRARMNDGAIGKGDYSQSTFTASLETGYTLPLSKLLALEPYGKVNYSRLGAADYTLSNGMQSAVNAANSVQGELGTLLSAKVTLGEVEVAPYAKLAIAREFTRSNTVTINDITLDNNYSGNVGKYGLGVSANITKNTAVYAEMNYLNGNKVESPLNATTGFRILF
ncbi:MULTISPECIES: autotransporter outer membrane beta-barrel domain-containing protein [unclassified Serratia (in: enterobacteria)]|uniref:autotransporter outer membrane beta-barrel domain-containing protein n=1 Tax=unclassified Serratia (in: enterobacteria) TaxID=2647522 RepID=UPI003075FDE7